MDTPEAARRDEDREAFARRPETIGAVAASAPQTGAEYLESLRDGRTVYIYGERVQDVTTHPAFRNTARMVARLYDALHDPKRKSKLLLPTDTGNGGMTHAFFKAPKTLDDLLAGRAAIAEWARITYGWMGRSPDYKASFLATLGANAEFYDPYQENARRWYKFAQSACRSSTTPSSIPPSTATGRPARWWTCARTWRGRRTRASSSRAPRWWPPARCSPTTPSSPTTGSCPCRTRNSPACS